VTKKVDADPVSAGSTDITSRVSAGGAATNVGGKRGAVREFTSWLCRDGTGSQPIETDNYTGKTFDQEISDTLLKYGFQSVPDAEITNGFCRLVPGP
jgi:hypothetical protein